MAAGTFTMERLVTLPGAVMTWLLGFVCAVITGKLPELKLKLLIGIWNLQVLVGIAPGSKSTVT